MSVVNPELSGVWPIPGDTDIPLKPTIHLVFKGASLIDPLTFNSGTFAVYGPGDVVIEAGPGTILNQDIQSDPYKLIDGAVFRERIEGTCRVYTSGLPPTSGIQISGTLGVSGSLVIAEFIPAVPLNAYTEYTVVLVGEEALDWSTSSRVFPGVTSWTSAPAFSGTTPTSGILTVLTPYSRILPSVLYDATSGYNDTYSIVITSGSTESAPKFTWERVSEGDIFSSEGPGPIDLGEGLTFVFSGIFEAGEQYDLDVYIPKPLELNYVWQFTTSDVSGSEPPVGGEEPNLIIDLTPGGGFGPVSAETDDVLLLSSIPDQMDYGVPATLPYILLELNHEISGVNISGIQIIQTPLLGMPNISGAGAITPTSIEISGSFLKLWLV